jgi:hydroxyacylglutathione hydrolase
MNPTIIQLRSSRTDNTFYLVHDGHAACLIDPVDPQVGLDAVEALGLRLDALLNTHWHPDHVGGNAAIFAAVPDARHFIPAAEADLIDTSHTTRVTLLRSGDVVSVGASILRVIETPGHTIGHLSLISEDALLCGDTLFSAGVGHCKLGGDAPQLARTITTTIAALPDHLRVFCGHDYARRNVAFALSLLPDDPALLAHAARLSAHGDTPLITTLGEERRFNLFLRCEEPALQAAALERGGDVVATRRGEGLSDAEATLCALRALRDVW